MGHWIRSKKGEEKCRQCSAVQCSAVCVCVPSQRPIYLCVFTSHLHVINEK